MKLCTVLFLCNAVGLGLLQAKEIKRKRLWTKVLSKGMFKTTDLRPDGVQAESLHLTQVFDLSLHELENLDPRIQAAFIKLYNKKTWKKLKQSKRREEKRLSCVSSSDCQPDECCAYHKRGRKMQCKKRHDLHQECNPFLLPGISQQCPCLTGLTCAEYNRDFEGRKQYMCVRVPKFPDERESIVSKL